MNVSDLKEAIEEEIVNREGTSMQQTADLHYSLDAAQASIIADINSFNEELRNLNPDTPFIIDPSEYIGRFFSDTLMNVQSGALDYNAIVAQNALASEAKSFSREVVIKDFQSKITAIAANKLLKDSLELTESDIKKFLETATTKDIVSSRLFNEDPREILRLLSREKRSEIWEEVIDAKYYADKSIAHVHQEYADAVTDDSYFGYLKRAEMAEGAMKDAEQDPNSRGKEIAKILDDGLSESEKAESDKAQLWMQEQIRECGSYEIFKESFRDIAETSKEYKGFSPRIQTLLYNAIYRDDKLPNEVSKAEEKASSAKEELIRMGYSSDKAEYIVYDMSMSEENRKKVKESADAGRTAQILSENYEKASKLRDRVEKPEDDHQKTFVEFELLTKPTKADTPKYERYTDDTPSENIRKTSEENKINAEKKAAKYQGLSQMFDMDKFQRTEEEMPNYSSFVAPKTSKINRDSFRAAQIETVANGVEYRSEKKYDEMEEGDLTETEQVIVQLMNSAEEPYKDDAHLAQLEAEDLTKKAKITIDSKGRYTAERIDELPRTEHEEMSEEEELKTTSIDEQSNPFEVVQEDDEPIADASQIPGAEPISEDTEYAFHFDMQEPMMDGFQIPGAEPFMAEQETPQEQVYGEQEVKVQQEQEQPLAEPEQIYEIQMEQEVQEPYQEITEEQPAVEPVIFNIAQQIQSEVGQMDERSPEEIEKEQEEFAKRLMEQEQEKADRANAKNPEPKKGVIARIRDWFKNTQEDSQMGWDAGRNLFERVASIGGGLNNFFASIPDRIKNIGQGKLGGKKQEKLQEGTGQRIGVQEEKSGLDSDEKSSVTGQEQNTITNAEPAVLESQIAENNANVQNNPWAINQADIQKIGPEAEIGPTEGVFANEKNTSEITISPDGTVYNVPIREEKQTDGVAR